MRQSEGKRDTEGANAGDTAKSRQFKPQPQPGYREKQRAQRQYQRQRRPHMLPRDGEPRPPCEPRHATRCGRSDIFSRAGLFHAGLSHACLRKLRHARLLAPLDAPHVAQPNTLWLTCQWHLCGRSPQKATFLYNAAMPLYNFAKPLYNLAKPKTLHCAWRNAMVRAQPRRLWIIKR